MVVEGGGDLGERGRKLPVATKHEAYQKPVVYKIIILGESGVG